MISSGPTSTDSILMPQETANFTPRFQTLARELIDKIKTRKLQPGVMLPSERELGLQYDLSRQTIRNAMQILEEGGWVVSHPGKGRFVLQQKPGELRNGTEKNEALVSTGQIGLICRAALLFEDAEAGHPLLGLKSAFSEHGYTLSISVATKDVKNRLHPVFPRWFKEDMMDGYILASAPPRVQERVAREPKPSVSLGYLWTDADIPSVEMDFREINRLSVHHLAERNLLPICNLVPHEKSIEDKKFTGERIEGHLAGAKELGLEPSQAEVVRYHDSAFDLVAALRRLYKRDAPPRSLILGSGRFLQEALAYLDRNGVIAPRDVSILVIEPSNAPEACRSRIGYFDADAFSLARRAGEKLLALMGDRDSGPRHERVAVGHFVPPTG